MNVTFATPAMLIGLLAAGIPLTLHLLASVRAPKVAFPTLRFLRLSMERTARRRHIQHWLLLVLRSLMLGLLALAAAEPISRAVGLGGRRSNAAAVIILDNSMSMSARTAGGTRFEAARAQAAQLLNGDDKPALAALLLTNGDSEADPQMTADLDDLRRLLPAAAVTARRAPMADRISQACRLLAEQTNPAKTIYVFSDMQAVSFDDLAYVRPPGADDISLVIINAAVGEVNNVGIVSLELTGHRVVNEVLTLTAKLVNSSPTSRAVDVALHVDGRPIGQRTRVTLTATGDGRTKAVRFRHRIGSDQPISGAVVIETPDDLADDNVRRFALRPARQVGVLIVAGAGEPADPPLLQPAGMLELVLNPYDDPASGSIQPRLVAAADFVPDDLAGADAVFFCEVPTFSAAQADAIDTFVRRGGTAMFFAGRGVSAANYNERFGGQDRAGLLPALLGETVGQVGPTAPAIASEWVDTAHPYLAGLYATATEYPVVLVQRYVRLKRTVGASLTLVRLASGDPLIVAKTHGRGRVVLSAAPASPRWSNMMIPGMVPGMVVRAALLASQHLGRDDTYIAGATVEIAPDLPTWADDVARLRIDIIPAQPGAAAPEPLPLADSERGPAATFTQTATAGVYHWRVLGPGLPDSPGGADGLFVINPVASESDLRLAEADQLKDALAGRSFAEVTIAPSLDAATTATVERAKGDNWWDVLLAVVVIALIVEAVIANRAHQAGWRNAQPGVGAAAGRTS